MAEESENQTPAEKPAAQIPEVAADTVEQTPVTSEAAAQEVAPVKAEAKAGKV